jgi:hypothetical protein
MNRDDDRNVTYLLRFLAIGLLAAGIVFIVPHKHSETVVDFLCANNCTEIDGGAYKGCACTCEGACTGYASAEQRTRAVYTRNLELGITLIFLALFAAFGASAQAEGAPRNARAEGAPRNARAAVNEEEPEAAPVNMRAVCAICKASVPNVVFHCGHTACSTCVRTLDPKLCHMCRVPFRDTYQLFLSTE